MVINRKTGQNTVRTPLSCPWLKRVGFYGLVFFLLKGLAWLVVPAALVYFGLR